MSNDRFEGSSVDLILVGIYHMRILVRIYHSSKQWFPTREHFAPQETFSNAWKHFWLSQLGERELLWERWADARDAVNILKGTGQRPTTKNYPPQNANSAKVEKLSSFEKFLNTHLSKNSIPPLFSIMFANSILFLLVFGNKLILIPIPSISF